MSFKPSRGSGIGFEKTYKNAEKYRQLYFDQINHLTFDSLKKSSKSLYFWMINENKTTGRKLDINMYAHITDINCLRRNENIIYKPLLKYLT